MSRFIIPILLLLIPLLGPGMTSVVLMIVAAYTAYRGPSSRVVYSMLGTLVVIELLYGFEIGILSLAYIFATLVLMALQRFIRMVPWAAQGGWNLTDALQSIVVAYMLLFLEKIFGVLVSYALYAYGALFQHMSSMITSAHYGIDLMFIGIILIIFRRIDEPFHQPIIFGV